MTTSRSHFLLRLSAGIALLASLITGAARAAAEQCTASSTRLHLNHPFGLAIEPQGPRHPEWIYVADSLNNRVVKLSSSGKLVAQWGTFGTALGEFMQPAAVAVGPTGTVYVIDYGNNRIETFSPTGKTLAQWGTFGSAPGQFAGPTDLTVDGRGHVFVADTLNSRIQEFSSFGWFLAQWHTQSDDPAQLPAITGVAVDDTHGTPGTIYVSEYGMTIDALGNVTVPAHGINRVQQLSFTGQLLADWGTKGSGPGQFDQPQGIAVDRQGLVYVADQGNDRVQRFSPTEGSIELLGQTGSRQQRLRMPTDVAVDPKGRIYVADWGNSRVVQLSVTDHVLSVWN